jgi:hypothetical protein
VFTIISRIPTRFLITGSFGLVLLLNTLFGELTYVGHGVGWGGWIYANFVAKFCRDVTEVFRTTEYYHLQRILPSLVVSIFLRAFHLPCDHSHIVSPFRWYNCAALIASVYVWTLISQRMQFSRKATWVSAVLLFLSFPVQKQYIYFPVSTEPTALLLSTGLLYCFLARYQLALFLISMLGAFCWPMIFYTGLALLLWPRSTMKTDTTANPWLAGLVTACAISFSLYCFFGSKVRLGGAEYHIAVLPLSITITSFLLFGAFLNLIPSSNEIWERFLAALMCPRLYILLGVACGLNLLFRMLSIGSGFEVHREMMGMSVAHLAKPGVSLLADVVYFGPVIFFALYRWNEISKLVKLAGFGMFIVFSEAVLQLLLDSESRRCLVFFPILVAYTVKALDGDRLSRSLFVFAVALAFVFSKLWFLFNLLPGRSTQPMDFPLQVFMCHFGPWMNFNWYIVYGTAALIIGFLVPIYWPQTIKPLPEMGSSIEETNTDKRVPQISE